MLILFAIFGALLVVTFIVVKAFLIAILAICALIYIGIFYGLLFAGIPLLTAWILTVIIGSLLILILYHLFS